MKKVYVLLLVLISFVEVGFSQNQAIFNDMISSAYRASGGNYDKVKVIISVKEGQNIQNAMDEVKNHMHMKDPNGIFNPYWVKSFPDEAFWGNDAVIIGTWYTEGYEGWSTWLAKLKPRLDDVASLSFYKVNPLGR